MYISRFLYSCMFSVCFFFSKLFFIYLHRSSVYGPIHLSTVKNSRASPTIHWDSRKKVNFKGRKMEQKVRTRVHSNKGYVSCTEWNPSFVVTWYSRVFQCCLCSLKRWRSFNKHYITSTKFCLMTCPVTCRHRVFSQYPLIICRSAKIVRIFFLVFLFRL